MAKGDKPTTSGSPRTATTKGPNKTTGGTMSVTRTVPSPPSKPPTKTTTPKGPKK